VRLMIREIRCMGTVPKGLKEENVVKIIFYVLSYYFYAN
jgi:hypothetical protein